MSTVQLVVGWFLFLTATGFWTYNQCTENGRYGKTEWNAWVIAMVWWVLLGGLVTSLV